jgi:hypothetical protein
LSVPKSEWFSDGWSDLNAANKSILADEFDNPSVDWIMVHTQVSNVNRPD